MTPGSGPFRVSFDNEFGVGVLVGPTIGTQYRGHHDSLTELAESLNAAYAAGQAAERAKLAAVVEAARNLSTHVHAHLNYINNRRETTGLMCETLRLSVGDVDTALDAGSQP